MADHLVIHWDKSIVDQFIVSLPTNDLKSLYDYLAEKYPEKDVKLEKYNFNYISNFSHYAAGGWALSMDYKSNEEQYMAGRGPAHFNPEYFHAVVSYG